MRLSTAILEWLEYGLCKEYIRVLSKIIFYLLQDGGKYLKLGFVALGVSSVVSKPYQYSNIRLLTALSSPREGTWGSFTGSWGGAGTLVDLGLSRSTAFQSS